MVQDTTKSSQKSQVPQNRLTRFSDRVQDYVRYRPSYPKAAIKYLMEYADLNDGDACADIGSGTGIFAELLLKEKLVVFGVEPNTPMRTAAEDLLAPYDNFHSIQGTAEATGLPPVSMKLITIAQAFHWFDVDRTKQEFRRILKPNGYVAITYNEKSEANAAFHDACASRLIKYSPERQQTSQTEDEDRIKSFFSNPSFQKHTFSNKQNLNLEELKGRMLSSSYAPKPGHANHEQFVQEIEAIFEEFQIEGKVPFEYSTEITLGRI